MSPRRPLRVALLTAVMGTAGAGGPMEAQVCERPCVGPPRGAIIAGGGGEDGQLVSAPERDVGFGFLRNVAIDQHLVARGRENDLLGVLDTRPHLLGIGLNEGAALLITGDLARVLGSRVAIYDVTDPLTLIPLRWLAPGEVYDLGGRRLVLSEQGGGE